jgi:hypothetical protein
MAGGGAIAAIAAIAAVASVAVVAAAVAAAAPPVVLRRNWKRQITSGHRPQILHGEIPIKKKIIGSSARF